MEATMGKEGVEPSRVAARDPKSRLSANSSTSPVNCTGIISASIFNVNNDLSFHIRNSPAFEYNKPPEN